MEHLQEWNRLLEQHMNAKHKVGRGGVANLGAGEHLADSPFVSLRDFLPPLDPQVWAQRWLEGIGVQQKRPVKTWSELALEEDSVSTDDEQSESDEAEEQWLEMEQRNQKHAEEQTQKKMAALADTGISDGQLNQLTWEYFDLLEWSGGADPTEGPEFLGWVRRRVADGTLNDDGGAAMRRVKKRLGFEHED